MYVLVKNSEDNEFGMVCIATLTKENAVDTLSQFFPFEVADILVKNRIVFFQVDNSVGYYVVILTTDEALIRKEGE